MCLWCCGYAASVLKIPTIIHEQNSVPGITNKFLTRYVDKIAIAFQDAAHYFPDKKTVLVGNPSGEVKTVRSLRSLLLATLTLRKTVLVFGGSQGALKINQAIIEAIPAFAKKDYQPLYASGDRYYQEIEEKIGMSKDAFPNISIRPYIDQNGRSHGE